MIKSPCRDCEKHKKQFPKCFESCQILKEIRRQEHDETVKTVNDFECMENYKTTYTRTYTYFE